MLTCLAGQSDRDFELLVMCHRTTSEEQAAVEDVVASAPAWLRDAVRVLRVERPGRAAPLNDGFTAARGRYVVALDDDDTVLAHYVSTFKAAATAHEGRLLRTVAVRQDVVPVGDGDDVRAISVADPYREWPLDFSLVDHLSDNYSPIMTVAFPRGAVHDLGLRFDEDLHANEDWEYVVRCAAVLGVASVREITSVYRWWLHTASSRDLHPEEQWDEARARIQEVVAESVLLLQPEEIHRLVATLDRSRREVASAHELAQATSTAQHETNVEMTKVAEAYEAAVAEAARRGGAPDGHQGRAGDGSGPAAPPHPAAAPAGARRRGPATHRRRHARPAGEAADGHDDPAVEAPRRGTSRRVLDGRGSVAAER